MIPLYGFLEGDTLGLLMLTDENETVASLARRLASSAAVRVAAPPELDVVVRGRVVERDATVAEAGLGPLDRFDVTRARPRAAPAPEERAR